jgi:hypothetical protein
MNDPKSKINKKAACFKTTGKMLKKLTPVDK